MKKRVLIVVAGVLVIGGAAAFAAIPRLGGSPEPKDSVSLETESNNTAEEYTDSDHDHTHDEESDTALITVGDRVLEEGELENKIIPAARKAAVEYIRQDTSETESARYNRLLEVFAPGSPVPASATPAVDTSRTNNTYSRAKVLYTAHKSFGTTIDVYVAVKIETFSKKTKKVVSRIYQMYVVTMKPRGTLYEAQAIALTLQPVIKTE